MLSLVNFVSGVYPVQNAPEFQRLISEYTEFQELASNPEDRHFYPGTHAYRPQIFTTRFMRNYDRLFNNWQTGTGKTCAFGNFAEYVEEHRGSFRQVVILAKGETHRNDLMNQLACVCTRGKYINDAVRNAQTAPSQKAAMTKAMKKWYHFTSYKKFAWGIRNEVAKLIKDQTVPVSEYPDRPEFKAYVIRKYSDTIFWIDEVHELRINPETFKENKVREKLIVYRFIHGVLQNAQRIKVVGSTATVAIHEVGEFISVANLILPPSRQIPLDLDLSEPTIEELEPYIRGLFSYVGALDNGSDLVTRGEKYEALHSEAPELTLYPCHMSSFQTEGYLKAKNNDSNAVYDAQIQASNFVFADGTWSVGETAKEKQERRRLAKIRKREREEARKAQGEGIKVKKTVTKKPNQDKEQVKIDVVKETARLNRSKSTRYIEIYGDTFKATPEFVKSIYPSSVKETPEFARSIRGNVFSMTSELAKLIKGKAREETIRNIAKYSCKDAEIIRKLDYHWEHGNGVIFIYDPKIYGSGLVSLALCLELLGYERFYEKESIFLGEGDKIKDFCDQDDVSGKIKEEFDPKKNPKRRYTILTSETSDARQTVLKQTVNSYANVEGRIIQVFFGTEVASQALSIDNAAAGIFRTPNWTDAQNFQTLSRIYRNNTVKNRLKFNLARGITTRPVVEFYAMIAIPKREGDLGVNYLQYQIASKGAVPIRKLNNVIRACAIDAQIHLKRNHPEMNFTSKTGFPTYEELLEAYERGYIVDPPAQQNITVNRNLLYIDNMVPKFVSKLEQEVFIERTFVTLSELVEEWKQESQLIQFTLARIIEQKIPIKNRFGFTFYLIEDRGTYLLSRIYPLGDQRITADVGYYTNHIILNRPYSLREIIKMKTIKPFLMKLPEKREDLENFFKLPKTWRNKIDFNFEPEEIVYVVERAIEILAQTPLAESRTATGVPSIEEMQAYIKERYIIQFLWRFRFYIFRYHEPIRQIAYLKDKEQVIKSGAPKRKLWNGKYHRIPKDFEFKETNDSPILYAHSVWTRFGATSAHGYAAKQMKADGDIRVYDPKTRIWRTLNAESDEHEAKAHNQKIQMLIEEMHKPFEDKVIYGYIYRTNTKKKSVKFNLVDRSLQDDKANGKQVKWGLDCLSWLFGELMYIIARLPNFPGFKDRRPGRKGRERMIEEIVEDRNPARRPLRNKQALTKREISKEWDDETVQRVWSWIVDPKSSRGALCEELREYFVSNGLMADY
jgi:hypothetical protein